LFSKYKSKNNNTTESSPVEAPILLIEAFNCSFIVKMKGLEVKPLIITRIQLEIQYEKFILEEIITILSNSSMRISKVSFQLKGLIFEATSPESHGNNLITRYTFQSGLLYYIFIQYYYFTLLTDEILHFNQLAKKYC
jgi:hypothetical protein